jgi:predicted nucleic-acid-binding protein
MKPIEEKFIINEIKLVMNNKNYRVAYEEAIKMAKEKNIKEKSDFFPFIFALDIRGEKADQFISEVLKS